MAILLGLIGGLLWFGITMIAIAIWGYHDPRL